MLRRHALWGASKDQRLAARASQIPKDARCILEHTNGSALYVYEVAGVPYVIAFWGTAGRSHLHNRCRSEQERHPVIIPTPR